MEPLTISADEFVGRLAERAPHTQHAFLLGAGCSVGSGIPAAGTLVSEIWLPRLYRWRAGDGEAFEEWTAQAFPDYDAASPALSYGTVMEELFPRPLEKQKEVERICRGRDPGFGCCVLAKLIERENPDFNVVLTTNFDDLLADALYLFTASRPLVIPHAALAGFMRADFDRPLVAKLHGDHQLEPLNTKEDLEQLNEQVRARLHSLLQQRGLVVMGYAGNDNSVMDALEALPHDDALGPGVWWVSRSRPNARVSEWLLARKGYWVQSSDFDQLMLLVQQHFDLPHPEIDRWEKLRTSYFEALSRLRVAVDELPQSEPSAPALKQASAEAIERIPDWWQVELRARPLTRSDPEAADAVYRDGIERLPRSPELLGNYAIFLEGVRKDYAAAEQMYKRALDADPAHGITLSNYARFLQRVHRDADAAETFYKRALDADPDNAITLNNYALFLQHMRRDADAAEALYKRAVNAGPENATVLSTYGVFVELVRRQMDVAESLYRRAVEAGPENALALGNYARFLQHVRRDADAAEALYKRAVSAEPDNAGVLGNYALFLQYMRRDADAAETFYKRALDAEPDNAGVLGSYALFLQGRDDADAAEGLYKHAIDIDPTLVSNLRNYASFLARVRRDLAAAETFFARAMAIEPDDADVLGSYALFLKNERNDPVAAEAFYVRALEADPTHAVNLGNYAVFLDTVSRDLTAAEAVHERAIAAEPTNADNLGNYARHLIWLDRLPEAYGYLDRALAQVDPGNVTLQSELWFYMYANGVAEQQGVALSTLKRLLVGGARSPGWDLTGNVERAREHGHPDAEWLPSLADVIAGKAPIESLEGWRAWESA